MKKDKQQKAPLKIPTIADLGGPSVENIRVISTLARRQMQLEDEIAALNEKLKEKSQALSKLSTEDIPLAMKAAQVKAIDLEDGCKVTVAPFITGNIKAEKQQEAFKWLRANKLGSLIKTAFSIGFGMGEENKAKVFTGVLAKLKIPYTSKEGVHPMTLQSMIRERLEAGKALPPSIEVVEVPKTTIKRPKEK